MPEKYSSLYVDKVQGVRLVFPRRFQLAGDAMKFDDDPILKAIKAKLEDAITLDGGDFRGMDLRGKPLVYLGGPMPKLEGADLDQSQWFFGGAAGRTCYMLSQLEKINPGYLVRTLAEFALPRETEH